MANYNRNNIDEPETVDITDSDESQQETDYKSEYEDFQNENFEDVRETVEDDYDYDPADDRLSEASAETRCVILQDHVTLLKININLLLSREGVYKQKLSSFEQHNRELNEKLLLSEKEVSKLEEEFEIHKTKSESRYSTLDKTYRELCISLMAAQEANQKLRYQINELTMKNKVLDELVEVKTKALAELETRVDSLRIMPETQNTPKPSSVRKFKIVSLRRRLSATERQMNLVVSDLSKMISYKFRPNDLRDGNTAKYFDYQTMLADYNEKCVKLNELELRASTNEYLPQIRFLKEKVKLLNKRIRIRSMLLMEREQNMVEFFKAQEEDLRNIIKEKEEEKSWKMAEFEKVMEDNKSLKMELEVKDKRIKELEEELERTKAEVKDTIKENQGLKSTVNKQTDNEKALKEELEAATERENTHMVKTKSYMDEVELKVRALELELKHSKEVASEAKRLQHDMALEHQKELHRLTEEREQEQKKEQDQKDQEQKQDQEQQKDQKEQEREREQKGMIDEEFKKALLEELSTLKNAVTSLEKSKKEQQQINNLILTLRHQNDTVLNALKEENRSTLNSLSEKNNASLSELRAENSKIVEALTNKVTSIAENMSRREEELTEQIRRQFETLKNELKSVQPEYGGGGTDPGPEEGAEPPGPGASEEQPRVGDEAEVPESGEGTKEPLLGDGVEVPELVEATKEPLLGDEFEVPGLEELEGEEGTEAGLEEKYKKLRALFKTTTASLLRKEKILLDSLKKTVLECHTYKQKLDLLTQAAQAAKDCSCDSLSKPQDSKAEPAENCWCNSRTNVFMRQRMARRSIECEKAALDHVKKLTTRKRISKRRLPLG